MLWVKKVYFYLVSLISLVIIVVGSIQLLNLALKQWVFTKADHDFYAPRVICPSPTEGKPVPDECVGQEPGPKEVKQQQEQRAAQRQREAANAIAMIVVGTPVFYFHFKSARRETQ